MQDFNIGQTVFYINWPDKKIGSRIINGVDIVDGIPRYWLQGYFGYFNKDILFKTHQHAVDCLKHLEAENDRIQQGIRESESK